MKAGKKAAFIFALWVGLSGIWFASSASAQSANLLEANQLYTQAMQLQQQGRHSEALPFAEKALAILEKEMGTEHPHVASAINSVALLHSAIGNYPQEETLYKRSLAITEKTFGSDHLNVGIIVRNLAVPYLTHREPERRRDDSELGGVELMGWGRGASS